MCSDNTTDVKCQNAKDSVGHSVNLTVSENAGENVAAPAISVSQVSKCYQVYAQPSDRLKQFIQPKLARLFRRAPRQYFSEFWALRDINFTISRGETVGIIGHNGAGKSTLLQLICGTLTASAGSVAVHGRIAALLELGAGFNPEFSGRDNVYLNGSVLGLTRDEIAARFAEIAAFADIGDFMERPVKTYSSGMYVRLAFAVQACIEPEILIVDEALAVGDIGFQYKCFKRMEALRAKGTTILMVTHSTGSILEYADRCIVMAGGQVVADTTDVLAAVMTYEKGMMLAEGAPAAMPASKQALGEVPTLDYLQHRQAAEANAALGEKRFGSARAIISELVIYKGDGSLLSEQPLIKAGDTLTLHFSLLACEAINDVVLGLSLSRAQGGDIWGDNNIAAGFPLTLQPGSQQLTYQVTLPINSGDYLLHCGLACLSGGEREELDQRRPMHNVKFWSNRELGGVVFAPITVLAQES